MVRKRGLKQRVSQLGESTRTYVLSYLQLGYVTMWLLSTSPRTQSAELLLETLKVPYNVCEIDKQSDALEIKEALFEYTHNRQLPCIFIGNNYIGSYEELKVASENGTLRLRLKEF